jgi:hypothetical protein
VDCDRPPGGRFWGLGAHGLWCDELLSLASATGRSLVSPIGPGAPAFTVEDFCAPPPIQNLGHDLAVVTHHLTGNELELDARMSLPEMRFRDGRPVCELDTPRACPKNVFGEPPPLARRAA